MFLAGPLLVEVRVERRSIYIYVMRERVREVC